MVVSTIVIFSLLILGRVDVSFGIINLQISHPNESFLILLICLCLYYWIRHSISFKEQLKIINEFLGRREKLSLVILVSFAFVYLARIKLMQHFTFNTGAYDLAMYDTAVRNTLEGKFLFADQLSRNFFSEHFSPILLLMCPLYLVFNSPVTLLVVEALVVSVGLVCVYKIAKHYHLSSVVSLFISLIFLNYTYLARGVMFDFHPEMMVPTFILGCVYFMLKRKLWAYLVCLVFALSCKEDIPIYTLCLGIYALFNKKSRLLGWLTCSISIIWAIVAWKFIIPAAMPSDAEVSHFVAARWGHLGDTYADVALALLSQPIYVLKCIFSKAPMDMLKELLFIPVLGIEALFIALPGLILNTTTNFEPQSTLCMHYSAPIIPFVIWGYIIGIKRVRTCAFTVTAKSPKIQKYIMPVGIAGLLVFMSLSFGAEYTFYSFEPHTFARYRVMERVPEGSSVSCGNDFVPHLVKKVTPYVFPYESNNDRKYRHCDYILLDRKGNSWPLQSDELNAEIDKILSITSRYEVIASEDEVYLFENIHKKNLKN